MVLLLKLQGRISVRRLFNLLLKQFNATDVKPCHSLLNTAINSKKTTTKNSFKCR